VIMKSVRLRGRLFAAVLHGFEAQASAVHMRILRTFLRKIYGSASSEVLAASRPGILLN
jgi:hypothetical protein